MSTREKKTFIVFSCLYMILTFMTSFMLESVLEENDPFNSPAFAPLIVVLIAALVLTLLYAWLTVRRNRRIWATLKCIGYTSGNVSHIILGYIFYTTFVGLIFTVEFCLHWVAIVGYWNSSFQPLVSLDSVLYTVLIFLGVQFAGYILARGKITKVRPMLALKRVGE